MKNFRMVGVAIAAVMLSACATQVKVAEVYKGKVTPLSQTQGASIEVQATVLSDKGATMPGLVVNPLKSVLADASQKHGFQLDKPDSDYRLNAEFQALPGKSLWKAEPQRGVNLGMAAIPIAGLFTPRYYDVSTSFAASFALYKGDQLIISDRVQIDDKKQISVSASKRAEESLQGAVLFWEEKRDLAIEGFFAKWAAQPGKLSSN